MKAGTKTEGEDHRFPISNETCLPAPRGLWAAGPGSGRPAAGSEAGTRAAAA